MLGRILACTILFSFNFLIVGCGTDKEETYPVRGIVRFPDGKLMREGTVEFEIMGRKEPMTATGDIGPDGSYQLGTFTLDDGAVAGQHRVVVISDHMIGNGAERPGMIPKQVLDPKYRDFRTSRLVFEVKEGNNDIAIDVQYAPVEPVEEPAPTS